MHAGTTEQQQGLGGKGGVDGQEALHAGLHLISSVLFVVQGFRLLEVRTRGTLHVRGRVAHVAKQKQMPLLHLTAKI